MEYKIGHNTYKIGQFTVKHLFKASNRHRPSHKNPRRSSMKSGLYLLLSKRFLLTSIPLKKYFRKIKIFDKIPLYKFREKWYNCCCQTTFRIKKLLKLNIIVFPLRSLRRLFVAFFTLY